MTRNAHGLEPTPAAAFRKMEKIEATAYRVRAILENKLIRAKRKRLEAEVTIMDLERQIWHVNRTVPRFGREIER